MSFLSPLLLLGLLAAALPPLIHLLNRREPKPVTFAAMEFLRRAQQRTARRVKLKQWLLIALRALLIAAVAYAMARPFWQPQVDDQLARDVSASDAGAQVIILDLSYHMGAQLSSGERLIDLARSHALSTLSDARGQVGLVLMGERVTTPLGALTAAQASTREALLNAAPSPSTRPLSEGVLEAYQLLRSVEPAERKRLVILTTPRRALSALPPPPPELGEVETLAVDLSASLPAADRSLTNHAITALHAQPAPQRGAEHWSVEVELHNWSDEPMELWPLWVEVEGEVKVRGFVTLAPGESGRKRLYFKASVDGPQAEGAQERGGGQGLKGSVKLAPDALPIDDERYFWLSPAPPTRLLALNGDPRPVPQEDELFYLRSALSPLVTGEGRFELQALPSSGEALSEQRLLWADVITLANLPRVSPELGRQLTRFVERGGGLWLAPGDRAEPSSWNRGLSALLARPLRGPRRSGDAAARLEDRQAARLGDFKAGHPLLSPFSDPLRSTLPRAELSAYMLVDPRPAPRSEVVVALNEGSPYLMTRSVGEGRVVQMGGPLDRAWSNLVIKADFVPLAQQVTRYLTRRASPRGLEARLGAPLKLNLSGAGPFYALSPNGERGSLSPHPELKRVWELNQTRPLGHHRVIDEAGGEQARFVVNLDAQDGELRPRSTEEAQDEPGQTATLTSRSVERLDLWPFALFMLFVLLALEALTLSRRGRGAARP